jgi:uncharacterized protein YraI
MPRHVLSLALLLAVGACMAAPGDRRMVVTGTGPDDMLKLRAGPGTGYRVISGLPEGTVLINRGCTRIGGTPWCDVALAEDRGLTGHVSGHYLQPE